MRVNKTSKKFHFQAKTHLKSLPFIPKRSSRYILALLLSGAALLFGILMILDNNAVGYALAIEGAFVTAIATALVLPWKQGLVVSPKGFSYKTMFSRDDVNWNEIKNVGYTNFGPIGLVTWDWADNLVKLGHRNNKWLKLSIGAGAYMVNSFEIDNEELAMVIEHMREKFAKKWASPVNNAAFGFQALAFEKAKHFGRAG